ncbi:xin actin-binding repeat-containing protein 2 isoform X2 [Cynoglossus semilaevis]|nr:xin actin-binding repeat-containing protein 2-like isoform X2 [Cynoglossus semilaevis]
MEESEVCSLPVGLMRKQFESRETASSQSVTQFHVQHRTVQETSNSSVTVSSSSREVVPGSQHLDFNQEKTVSYMDSNLGSSYENNQNEIEEFPRYTTKELRDRFERTIEEAAPQKPVKIGRDINRAKWSSNVTQNTAVTSEVYEASGTESKQDITAALMDYEDFPPPPAEDSDYLPPPPPDLLQMPLDNHSIAAGYYSPEPPEPPEPVNTKYPLSREAYFKQRGMLELKRLYKHIHPEVRKNIEKDFHSNNNQIENNGLESEEYSYEEVGDIAEEMNDDEYGEWEEILPGEVQALRWKFENKPLDDIKDETPVEDDDDKKITQQEIILGKDVRRTAWMFETKQIDELGSQNTNSTEYKNKFNKFDKGGVRAATWLFETQTMDCLNKMHKGEDLTKEVVFTEEDENATIYMIDNKHMESLGHTETIDESRLLILRAVLEEINGDVKTVTSTFDTQFKCIIMGQSSQMLEIKSVRKIESELGNSIASRWLFDTQPLDMANIDTTNLKLVCSLSMEDSSKGDWGRWLFEIKTLKSLTEWESSQIEKRDVVGADVHKHRLTFETQSVDTLKDDSDARAQGLEEIIGGNVRSARNFFESSPQIARKNCTEVGKLKKTTFNEEIKGDVRHQKWRFESQPLEHIRDEKKEVTRTVNVEEDFTQEDGTICKADVRKNCWVFETQPMDTLKDDANSRSLTKEEIISGNVKSARNYFETIPAEELKELAEVGKLKKRVSQEEEKGDVRHQKWRFECQPLEEIREEKKEIVRTIDLEEIDKVDVSNYKQIFETTDLNKWDESQKIVIEGAKSGCVKSNKDLFESTQLYAMQDSSGHFHEVRTVRREEVVKGDVTTCKWMFETRPIDQFDESINKYQIIKGISKQEVESGDVKTAKWLFETQPLDAIKYFSNIEDEETVVTSINQDIVRGDVKTCKWLFETKPMDVLYEKVELKGESEEMHKGDVKTCTWLFETQALDTIHDETETVLKTCTVNQEDIRGKDVRTACFLFETEKLENLTGEEESGSFKRVTQIDIASGDVSKMKYVFENQISDIMTSTSEEEMQKLRRVQSEDIQKGNVDTCKWLFENQSIDTIHDSQEESIRGRTVIDVQGGDVDKGRFIFERYSLDEIHEETDSDMMKIKRIVCDTEEKGDVRNYTMMFETQPLYAIQDKEGHYHEVTTVTSEEVTRGDVVGTRWLFETKPLDAIKDTNEVYIIKSVTQQDVQKGDVTSAKWKFETQPLDRIAAEKKTLIKTVDDIQGGNVRINTQRFESDDLSQDSVRTVNVSEIQKGDVSTAKWRFETQSIDKIQSMSAENLIETVKKEEVAKGDVKHSVWMFEKNPLDHIKEVDESQETVVTQEEIPKADVKTTTWLFETTPFDDFNETKIEKTEILGKSVKGTLEELYSQKMVKSKGILIEADEIGDVRMAKYQLMNQQEPEIQREEVIRGDLQTIMMNLLKRQDRNERQIIIDSEEKGNINSTVQQLFNQERDSTCKQEEILRGDIQEAINNLFNTDSSAKHGILIQEDEKGDVQMTIYSLLNQQENVNVEKEDVVRADIRSVLKKLSSSDKMDESLKIKVGETEKGHVNFFSTCIESGSLDFLRQVHLGPEESSSEKVQKEEIIGGNIKDTKFILSHNQMQIERTVEDVIPGDVHNTVKVFMTEPSVSLNNLQKEEIVKGDLRAALHSLSESANQTVVVEKEEVVKGNIPKALRYLEKAQNRTKEVEKPDIIPGNIRGALRSLEKSATSKSKIDAEELVAGDVRATMKSLELAQQTVREVEREDIVKGDIYTAMQNLQDASSERKTYHQEIDVQGDVRGTIQIFMEPPSSPIMQRSPSLEREAKGDVKMSIKSLYETQEQSQVEKEEVIKGDVKGTIKSLMETAERQTPKVRVGAYRRVKVKQAPPVKNLNVDAQRNIQKIKTANVVETSQENQSINETQTAKSTVTQSSQQSTTLVEHKTITQKHGIKTVKTEFRNLKSSTRGGKKLDRTKVKTDVYIIKPQSAEPDLPLPPPPVVEVELPPPPPTPPPPPATVDSDADHLPPPPPPLTSEQDFLPPPPSQQELERIPVQVLNQTKAKKMTVKKVKAPALHQVPKLESKVDLSGTQQVKVTSEKVEIGQKTQHVKKTTEKVMEISQTQSKVTTTQSKTVSSAILPPPESPQPLKKVISPMKFTPPPSPPPAMRGKSSKFTTPLIKAEEKFRKMREEEHTTLTAPTDIHDSVSAALEMLSMEHANNNPAVVTNQNAQITAFKADFAQGHASHEKMLTDSSIMSTTAQKVVSNESSKIVSFQKTSSTTAVRQQMHTTVQKTVLSTQSGVSVNLEKFQTSNTDVAKADTKAVDRKKDSKTPKAKSINKAEDKKEDKTPVQTAKHEISVTAEENVKSSKSLSEAKKTADKEPKITNNLLSSKKETVSSDKTAKESKLPRHENTKKNDHSPTKSQEKVPDQSMQIAAANANGKTSKQNHKVKKSNKQEKQEETRFSSEREEKIVSQDQKMEDKGVKVISQSGNVKKEIIQEIKVTACPATSSAPVVTEMITETQQETPTTTKKKKKSKKSKGVSPPGQSKDVSTESKFEATEIKAVTSEKSIQSKSTTVVSKTHKSLKEEHIKVTTEGAALDSKDHQQQNGVQKQVTAPENKRAVPEEQRQESKTAPEKPTSLERKGQDKGSLVRSKENETREKQGSDSNSEKDVSGATRISKISIGSAKVESQQIKKTTQDYSKEDVSQFKLLDIRAPSPLLRMRSPSPTFITIESTRRTDSPQRVTPSPTLLHRPPTPPTPPPRRCETPTSRITRITPSPTFDRAENLARLKDTTAKLSRGVTPPPLLSQQQISEKKSEIVESPASFHRQIKVESQVVDIPLSSFEKSIKTFSDEAHVDDELTKILQDLNANEVQHRAETKQDTDFDANSELPEPSAASVKEKREFFEEAQKAEVNKTYVRKEPISIPERLGPDLEEIMVENDKEKDELIRADLSCLVNKFESPEEKIHLRKEIIPLAEQLQVDTKSTDCDEKEEDPFKERVPTFDFQVIKNIFGQGEQSFSFREEGEKDKEEPQSSLSEKTVDTSKLEKTQGTKEKSRQSTPLPVTKYEVEAAPADPSGFSEAKSITEHFSNLDEFGNQVTGTRTAVTMHSESVTTNQAPFSYADVVKRKALPVRQTETCDEDATERLLRNFHETWTESEAVFKSLGYTISEESTSQVTSHQLFSSGSSSEVRAVHGMSEESLSHGRCDSGQKEVP